jgi:predicted PurR-regulated permease PerM
MSLSRIVEYAFFFSLLLLSGYMVWLITSPFLSSLALAAVIVTISSPLYQWLVPRMPRQNRSIAALLSTLIVFTIGIMPIAFISTLVVNELISLYQDIDQDGSLTFGGTLTMLESQIGLILPGLELNLAEQLRLVAEWLTGNLASIFASTISTVFLFFIAIIASFYFFRDGQELLQVLIKASPLPDHEDKEILDRLGRAVRAVATGTLFVALIQGTLAAIGLTLFGVDRAILLGAVAAIGAMIPGVGTGIVMIPIVITLFVTGNIVSGVGLLIWSVVVVGLVDNLIGPYLMSRGNKLHPFIILISVLGGISLFGPIGFLIGPVVVTLFLVLLEIYNQHIVQDQRITSTDDSSYDLAPTNRNHS